MLSILMNKHAISHPQEACLAIEQQNTNTQFFPVAIATLVLESYNDDMIIIFVDIVTLDYYGILLYMCEHENFN